MRQRAISNKPYSCLAVDDDDVSLEVIKSLINKTESLHPVGYFTNPLQAADAVLQETPDILFLDIEMPEMSGLELIKTLVTQPEIIIVSSKKDYAIEAFEYRVTDYLLKPIESYPRFLQAVNYAINAIEDKNKKLLGETRNIFVKVDRMLTSIDLNDILILEAFGDYVKIHTAEKTLVVYAKLKSVEAALPPQDFVRIHRSFVVRLDKIENIDQTNLQVNKKIIPISHSHKHDLLQRIKLI